MTRNPRFAALLTLLLSAPGCSSMTTVLQTKAAGGGTSVDYAVKSDQAFDLCRTVLRWEGSDAIEEHRYENYLLTSWGAGYSKEGTVAGAFVEVVDAEHTKVTVVTHRRKSLSLLTELTEETFHKRFAQALEILASGQPLPLLPPEAPPSPPGRKR